MKRKTVERRRGKIGNYAIRRTEQMRGQFRPTSPFRLTDSSSGMSLEVFKKLKKGIYHATNKAQ